MFAAAQVRTRTARRHTYNKALDGAIINFGGKKSKNTISRRPPTGKATRLAAMRFYMYGFATRKEEVEDDLRMKRAVHRCSRQRVGVR